MSDRASVVFAALGDGERMTTDQIVEATGLERSAVSQELTALKAAGKAISGRGGWSLTDAGAPRVKRHEAAEASEDAERRARDRKRKAAKKARVEKVPARPRPATDGASAYVFGITEDGELTITDRTDVAKVARINGTDTMRLARFLQARADLLGGSA